MRLTIIGGGGFRVPLIYQALLEEALGVSEVVLHDIDPDRLETIGVVLDQMTRSASRALPVSLVTDLDHALVGADFVFSAIRVGGLPARVIDEGVARELGVLGQETVGAGGIAYGLRTIPIALDLAERIARIAPDAWVVNFTNPAGMVTEAMSRHLGDRVVGVCDSPLGLTTRVARALGVESEEAYFDYAGLNHLGWLRAVYVGGRDRLPELMDDVERLESFEEGKLFGAAWLRSLGAVPNEYLHYFYYAREVLAAEQSAEVTRGSVLLDQDRRFREAARTDTSTALDSWHHARNQREATYMAESRAAFGGLERDSCDIQSGGYEKIALALLRAIATDTTSTLILNVRNRATLPTLDRDAVVEVPCVVAANGPRPITVDPLAAHAAGLVGAVKAAERATIEAAATGSRSSALQALAFHPLVDSVHVAGALLDAYVENHPELAYLAL